VSKQAPRFDLVDRRPVDCERLFSVHPPVVMPDGRTADHVVAGYPMESWVGPDYGPQVFASDANGRVIDWGNTVRDWSLGDDLTPTGWPADWPAAMLAAF